jgi:hypothetical protein
MLWGSQQEKEGRASMNPVPATGIRRERNIAGTNHARRSASASGFNSAVARTGGLVATALLGTVLAARGPALLTAFHGAMIAGSVACAVAAFSAFALLARIKDQRNARHSSSSGIESEGLLHGGPTDGPF